MTRYVLLLALGCALSLPVEAGVDPDILVKGQRADADSREEARAYVAATGIARGIRPVARWLAPVCPKVLGIAPPLAARAEQRIRALAVSSGARVGAEGCDSNLVVSFVADAPAVAQSMRRKDPRMFAEADVALRDAFSEGNAPVRWWYGSAIRGRDGSAVAVDAPPGSGGGEGGMSPLNVNSGMTRPPSPSLISTQVMRGIEAVTVLVDVNRATGRRLDDVVDYAAFVSLAEMYPANPPPTNSILGMFSGGNEGLSDGDRRLLAALYRLPMDRTARRQRGLLAIGVDADSERAEQDKGVDKAE